jgi:hypothetical protein
MKHILTRCKAPAAVLSVVLFTRSAKSFSLSLLLERRYRVQSSGCGIARAALPSACGRLHPPESPCDRRLSRIEEDLRHGGQVFGGDDGPQQRYADRLRGRRARDTSRLGLAVFWERGGQVQVKSCAATMATDRPQAPTMRLND